MRNTTIRLRDDQTAFIARVIRERATDLSAFVRLCVDGAAVAAAQTLPPRLSLDPNHLSNGRRQPKPTSKAKRMVSFGKLQRVAATARTAKARAK